MQKQSSLGQFKSSKVSEFSQLTTSNKMMVQSMREENSILSDQLVTQKQKIKTEDSQMNINLLKLQDECAVYAQKIETETKRKQDLEELLQQIRDRFAEQTRLSNASQGAELPKKQKQLKNNEFQLQQIHQKHNEQLAEIQELKEALNIARRERVIYSTVFKGIERDAIDKQHEFMQLIKQSEIHKVELKELMELLEQTQQMAKVEQDKFMIDYQQQFQQYQQENDKSSYHQGSKIMKTGESLIEDPYHVTEANMVVNQDPKHNARHLTVAMVDTSSQVKLYEQLFEKLAIETGMKSADQIVHSFINQDTIVEDTYTDINQVISNIDQIEREISQLDQQLNVQLEKSGRIKQMKDREAQFAEGSKLSSIQKMDKKIEQLKKEIENQQNALLSVQKSLEINVLDNDVNEWNLNQYTRTLEEKINNITTVSKLIEHSDLKEIKQHFQQSFENSIDEPSMTQSREAIVHKLDDLLGTSIRKFKQKVDKMKESEKIISPEELKRQSMIVINQKNKNLRKSKL